MARTKVASKKAKTSAVAVDPDYVIQFIGKKKVKDPLTGKPKSVPADPPAEIKNGSVHAVFPSPDEMRAGFTHKHAKFLVKNYRNLFKRKVSKGRKVSLGTKGKK